jgi:hypothetical protein
MALDSFAQKLGRVERAVGEVERLLQGEGLEAARALVTAVLEVHREALEELVLAAGGPEKLTAALEGRPKVAWLFGLHGMSPSPLEGRAHEALRAAHAVPASTARAELVNVAGDRVTVRVAGGIEDARRLLARAVERTMAELAPEAEVVIEGVGSPEAPELFSAERLVRRREESLP